MCSTGRRGMRSTGSEGPVRHHASGHFQGHFGIKVPVMAGLVPAIHELRLTRRVWMAATRAAMTIGVEIYTANFRIGTLTILNYP